MPPSLRPMVAGARAPDRADRSRAVAPAPQYDARRRRRSRATSPARRATLKKGRARLGRQFRVLSTGFIPPFWGRAATGCRTRRIDQMTNGSNRATQSRVAPLLSPSPFPVRDQLSHFWPAVGDRLLFLSHAPAGLSPKGLGAARRLMVAWLTP
jgi:hypothetical protein